MDRLRPLADRILDLKQDVAEWHKNAAKYPEGSYEQQWYLAGADSYREQLVALTLQEKLGAK